MRKYFFLFRYEWIYLRWSLLGVFYFILIEEFLVFCGFRVGGGEWLFVYRDGFILVGVRLLYF